MRRSIYRLSKVAEEGAKGRSGVQRGAQDDEADEGIRLTEVSSGGTTQGKRESNSALRRRTQSCVQTSFAGAESDDDDGTAGEQKVRLRAYLQLFACARAAAVCQVTGGRWVCGRGGRRRRGHMC